MRKTGALYGIVFCALALFLVSVTASPGLAQSCLIPPAGMVSWWPGDGSANDIVGTNHGTVNGGTTFVSGQVAQAFSFDGSGDFVNIPDNATLDLTQNITLDAWIKGASFTLPFSSETQDRNIYVISKDSNTGRSYGIGVSDYSCPGGPHAFMIAFTTSAYALACGTTVLNTGQYYHLAGTYDSATGLAKVYVNGTQDGTATLLPGSTLISGPANVQIGARQYPGYRAFFNGEIDEVEIFNRALSATEVLSIFTAGSVGKCKVQATIDIKPGSFPNSINLGSAGVIPVAILSSNTFDATQVDPMTIDLMGASVKLVGKSLKPLCHVEDVNSDSLADLLCQVYTYDFLVQPGADTATLKAMTFAGIWVWGQDSIEIVP